MPTVTRKRGDTHPAIQETLVHADGTVAALGVGDAVHFHMADLATGLIIVNALATVVDGPTGKVKYQPVTVDVDQDGDFGVEWYVVYADASVETFPADETDRLILHIETGEVPTRDEDVVWVRQQSLGAVGFGDDQIASLLTTWTMLDTDGVTVIPDRWAVVAIVLESRLLQAMADPMTGASQVRTGDTAVHYSSGAGATLMLRSFITRAWALADPANRAVGRPSGWRTVSIDSGPRFQLWNTLLPEQIVN